MPRRAPGTWKGASSPLKLMAHGWKPQVGFQEGIRRTVEHFRGIDLPHPGIPQWAP